MIPCQDCGHDNPLGTVFCHRCGERLQVNLQQVAGSVAVSRSHDRINRISTAARNALMVAVFLLLAALIIRYTLVPDLPPVTLMPATDPDDVTLFTSNTPWLARDTSLAALTPPPLPSTVHVTTPSLLTWRDTMGLQRLRSCGIDPALMHRAQLNLLQHQNPDGSFAGTDVLVATGLAALALQAVPPPSSGEERERLLEALDKAQRWLLVRVRTPGHQRQSSLGRTLATMVALEGEALSAVERRTVLMRAMDREEPLWQLMALLSCPPEDRPDDVITGLISAIGDNHIGRVVGALLDRRQAVVLDDAAFTTAAAQASTGGQAVAWAVAAWYRGAAPRVTMSQGLAWGESGICPADEGLLRAAPVIAEPALAILAASAPIRAPVSWVALP